MPTASAATSATPASDSTLAEGTAAACVDVAPDAAPGGRSATDRPTALAPLHLRLFALLFDYAVIVAGVKLAEQVLLGEHWDLRPLPAATGWHALGSPWQALMLALLALRDTPGTSVGKWLTGLRLGRAGDPARMPGAARRLLRNVSLILLPVDVWLVFRDRYGRRLGERWAGTVLVQNPRPRDLFQRAMGLGVLFLGFILAALLVTSWNLRRSAAFQAAYSAAERSAALAEQVGQPPNVDRSPDLELTLPSASGPSPSSANPSSTSVEPAGRASALFDVTGPKGKAKLRVELTLLPATGAEPPRWQVERTEVLDALGGPLKQQAAPPPR